MVTYSKGTQTAEVSIGVGSEAALDENGLSTDARRLDEGSGRETEDEMRKRILEEMEKEKREVERELGELKEREDRLAGKFR